MPLVRAYIAVDKKGDELTVGLEEDEVAEKLFVACSEVVPAGMNSPEGPLTPGSIEYFPHFSSSRGMGTSVFVEIEAFPYKDRENLDDRAETIKEALNEIFPGLTFAVWPKLVRAGWSSDHSDPDFDGDMSMEAAIQRALSALTPTR